MRRHPTCSEDHWTSPRETLACELCLQFKELWRNLTIQNPGPYRTATSGPPLASYADALWACHAVGQEDCVTSPKKVYIGYPLTTGEGALSTELHVWIGRKFSFDFTWKWSSFLKEKLTIDLSPNVWLYLYTCSSVCETSHRLPIVTLNWTPEANRHLL